MGFVKLTVRVANFVDQARAEEIEELGLVIDPARGELKPIHFRLGGLGGSAAASVHPASSAQP